jgi:soluble lytic murein transglycosylase-like protein
MKLTRRNTRLRSFRNISLTLFAIFLLTNFTDSPFTRVLAPVSVAAKTAAAEDYIPADIPTSGDANLDRIIMRVGESEGVDPRLIHAVIWQESRYNPNAVSHVGAKGLMQLMPDAAKRFDCADRNDEEANVEAGTKYLRWLLKHFNGDVSLALAGYNAGEGAVEKSGGVPAFAETQNYVRVIEGRYGKSYHPVLSPEDAAAYFNLLPGAQQAVASN